MNLFPKAILIVLFSFYSFISFAQKEIDPLHKRKYTLSLNELKDGVPQKKLIPDIIEFKNGKLFSDYVYDKFQFKWIKYRTLKDSIYTDSTDTEVRYFQIEATATDEKNQTIIMEFELLEWDIDGEIKITKNDKLKKNFLMFGRSKGSKLKRRDKKPLPKMTVEGQEAVDPNKKE